MTLFFIRNQRRISIRSKILKTGIHFSYAHPMKVAAVIPARGGSKSIPGKNTVQMAGKPLIAWTIETSQKTAIVDRTIVSTDSLEIADISKKYGAEVPFMRPPELAQDDTPGVQPFIHAVKWLEDHENYLPDYALYLQPTSPLRNVSDIEAAVKLAISKNADAVVSVTTPEHHPYWMKKVDQDGRMEDFIPTEKPYIRRQDLPKAFALNGAIYLVRRDVLLARGSWYTESTYAFIMPPERSIDIDSPWHLSLAEFLLKEKGQC